MTDRKQKIKQELLTFIRDNILSDTNEPQNLVFLTLHYCRVQKDIESAKETLRPILADLLSKLQNKLWHKHPYESITIIEHGKRQILHAHTILNIRHKTIDDLRKALTKISESNKNIKLTFDIDLTNPPSPKNKSYIPTKNHMLIKPVYDLHNLSEYIIKEYHLDESQIDFSNFYTSDLLFQQ